jgi:iron complex outermembrane receptor protein
MKQVMIILAWVSGFGYLHAQFVITGTVKDRDGNPLTGANVIVKNTFLGTVTDHQGKFSINSLKAGKYTLQVSFMGFKPVEKPVSLNNNLTIDIELESSSIMGDEVIISAVRATQKTPATYSIIHAEKLAGINLGKDLPYLIADQPSVVVTSDAGNGVGYTGLRIRGSDLTRINVTINGIPVNDPESHYVFWVDLPDFASSVNSMQIQRGVGSSTNGAGAFGASINIETDATKRNPFAEINSSYGSFNTLKNTIKLGTGLLNNHWYLNGRASIIKSDGYIDRASADLKSVYLQGGFCSEKTMIKALAFSGIEHTYQAWYGIDAETMKTSRTFNWAGVIFNNDGSLSFYENQVDHYQQDYYQIHFSHQLASSLKVNLSGHYTYGRGYYEEYRQDEPFEDYGLNPLYFGQDSMLNGETYNYFFHDTISTTDLIRRRWLDNHFYGFTYSLHYQLTKFDLLFGGAFNTYTNARHFGEIIWAEYSSQAEKNHVYYDNTADKTDFNSFIKIIFTPYKRISLYGDIQYRKIDYRVTGTESGLDTINISEVFHFFNPKAGISFALTDGLTLYASYSVANREPIRNDFIYAQHGEKPNYETLADIEAGIRKKNIKYTLSGNMFLMQYRNQLVLTGEINDVGAYIRKNTGKSYRMGIEISGSYQVLQAISLNGNVAVSKNKTDFKQLNDLGELITYKNSDISFSPWLVSFMQVSILPVRQLSVDLSGKYVSEQYLDNTQNNNLKLDGYFINDARIRYKAQLHLIPDIEIMLQVNNIFNKKYQSNGYVYDGIPYYYPQAGINFHLGITCRW